MLAEVELDQLYLSPHRGQRRLPAFTPLDIANARRHGILQPVIARQHRSGRNGAIRYEILLHENSWYLAQKAQLPRVPVWVRADLDDDEARALVERAGGPGGLNPIDEARLMQALLDEDPSLSKAELGRRLVRNRSTVSNLLRLLELDVEVQQRIQSGNLNEGHARALLGLPAASQRQLALQVTLEKLSVRDTELRARTLKKPAAITAAVSSTSQTNTQNDAAINYLEQKLGEWLGSPVEISDQALRIRHSGNMAVLEGLLEKGQCGDTAQLLAALCQQQFRLEPQHLVFDYHGDLDCLQKILERFGYCER